AYPFDLSYLLPVIVTQPQSFTVVEGCAATFKVVATSPPPLSYQWRRNDADLSGATNDTLTVANVTVTQNGQQYSVVVSNVARSVTSSIVTLTVSLDLSPVVVLAQPQSQTVVVGTNASFTVSASKSRGCLGSDVLAYQWFF